MLESNATLITEGSINSANIIGPIIGGIIAASAGFAVMIYREKITERKEKEKLEQHRKLVAKVLYDEVQNYRQFFRRILNDYSTRSFDEAFRDMENGRAAIENFEIGAYNALVNSDIVTGGPMGSFIPELNPFSTLYEDILKIDNIEAQRKLLQFYRYLQMADEYWRNYCDENSRISTDLRHFLETIERANTLLADDELLTYLNIIFNPHQNQH